MSVPIYRHKFSSNLNFIATGSFHYDQSGLAGIEYIAVVIYDPDPSSPFSVHRYRPMIPMICEQYNTTPVAYITYLEAIQYIRNCTRRFNQYFEDLINTNNTRYINPVFVECNYAAELYLENELIPAALKLLRQKTAARTIQKRWRTVITNPHHHICIRRLLREFTEMAS